MSFKHVVDEEKNIILLEARGKALVVEIIAEIQPTR